MAQGEGARPRGRGDEGGGGAGVTHPALARTAARYRSCDRFTRYYVACKVRMDPVHAAVLALAAARGFGSVLDLGCGRGQLAVALLEAGGADTVVAVDQDAAALAQLAVAAQGLALRTQCADLVTAIVGPADTVLLIDVLYQLPTGPQLDLLRRAAGLARGMVLVRAGDPAGGWRTALSAALERMGRRFWPTFGERANPLPLRQLGDVLEGCGFSVETVPCAQGTPFASVLLVGRRSGACYEER